MKFKVLFFIVLLALSATYTCFADEVWCTSTPETVLPYLNENNSFSLYSDSTSDEERIAFQNYIVEQCLQHTEIIDISHFECQIADAERYFLDIAMKRPDILVYTIFEIRHNSKTEIATAIAPTYVFNTIEEDKAARKLMEKEIEDYIKPAKKFDDPIERLLAIHDELVEECDWFGSSEDIGNSEVSEFFYRHAYSLFSEKRGVCQAYAQAFYTLATELGCEVDYCVSDDMNHSWNYIKLDGEWYHLDVTHDDPKLINSKDETFFVDHGYHDHFLCSDDKIHQGGGYVLEPRKWTNYLGEHIVCDSDKYESNYIFNMKGRFDIRFREDGKICAEAEYNFGDVEATVNYVYDSLYINEPMIVSEPFKIGSTNYVYYEPIAEIKNPPSLVLTVTKNNGKMVQMKVPLLNSETFMKGISINLNPKKSGYKIKYMLLDLYDIKPLSKAVVVE